MKLTIYTGRVEDVLPTLEAGAFDAALCDPPYGLGFLGKSWDTFKPGDSPMRRRAETDAVNAGAARQGGRQRACADFQRRQAREMHSFQAWCEAWAALVLDRLRPGAHLFAFGGTRTYHRLACAIEDAGFEIRDSFAWIYAEGYPKSLDIGRAVDALDAVGPRRDRALRFTAWMRSTGVTAAQINAATDSYMASHFLTEREQPEIPTPEMWEKIRPLVAGDVPAEILELIESRRVESENVKRRPVVALVEGADLLNSRPVSIAAQGLERAGKRVYAKTAPHSIDAKRWHGYGTAAKPAHEPVTVAMKPLDGTFAANALRHGVSGLNIDDSRIAVAGGSPAAARRDASQAAPRNREDGPIQNRTSEERYREARLGEEIGRWPANVLLGHAAACELEGACGPECPVAVLDSQSGIVEAKEPSVVRKGETGSDRLGNTSPAFGAENRPSGTVTGVNRGDAGGASRFFYCAKPDSDERNGSRHPTLKPCDLTGYLARMMLPPPRRPGEPPRRILVPFAGAGSEVIGCLRAGWDEVVAVEMSPEFCADIRRRVYREFGLLVTIETGASVDAVAER